MNELKKEMRKELRIILFSLEGLEIYNKESKLDERMKVRRTKKKNENENSKCEYEI